MSTVLKNAMVRQSERSEATVTAILAAARKLFAAAGFEATSIDAIAEEAGVAKGAVYHHFASKEEIFTRVLEGVQADIAAAPPPAVLRRIADPMDRIAAGALHYLNAATEPGVKRILLVDGPTVIGWRKWREIDDRYFGDGTKAMLAYALGEKANTREVAMLAHLLMGAVMEAALVCASADDPKRSARELAKALRRYLQGLKT